MKNLMNLPIKMSLDAWYNEVSRADKLINELSDDDLKREVAPGRNTGVYLLGHLAAVHDALFPLLGV
ncbi:MAG: DinB family protein, partial [Bacteroidota bacterium]|nr:DinB family protein [Bacteroidota bacterium]